MWSCHSLEARQLCPFISVIRNKLEAGTQEKANVLNSNVAEENGLRNPTTATCEAVACCPVVTAEAGFSHPPGRGQCVGQKHKQGEAGGNARRGSPRWGQLPPTVHTQVLVSPAF